MISAVRRREERRCWSVEKSRIKRGALRRWTKLRAGKTVVVRCLCPQYLDIFAQKRRASSILFFENIRRASRRDGVSIFLDFRNCDIIYPSGGLLLIAEIQRAQSDPLKKRIVVGNRAHNTIVDQVLKQIGIYKSLGIDCPIEPDHETVKHWRPATGTLSDGQTGGSVLEQYEGRLADGLTRGLYDGIVEAMTNTLHHAYIGDLGAGLKFGMGRRWWMLSQEKDALLTVAICDLGIGIPRSLPLSKTFSSDLVQRVWSKLGLDRNDGNAIKVAVELGRTRTNQQGRGKGLSEIIDAVNLSDAGVVLISSNRGIFTSSPQGSYTRTDSHSIHGTLIVWTVPIVDEGGALGE